MSEMFFLHYVESSVIDVNDSSMDAIEPFNTEDNRIEEHEEIENSASISKIVDLDNNDNLKNPRENADCIVETTVENDEVNEELVTVLDSNTNNDDENDVMEDDIEDDESLICILEPVEILGMFIKLISELP